MRISLAVIVTLFVGLATLSPTEIAVAAPAAGGVYTDPAKADEDFAFQGEYAGEVAIDAQTTKVGVQVVALGNGGFDVVAYPGGLPGAGWEPPAQKVTGKGVRDGSRVKVDGVDWNGVKRQAEIRDGAFIVLGDGGSEIAKLPKVSRKSPTLGQAPPAGAVVIFDGKGTDKLVNGRMTEDGLLMEGVTSKDFFGDALWHIEFRLPYQPAARGQGRGNSGAYVQGAYEVQMLDSFGLEGKNNECGGIYSVAAPRVNMCLPPLEWQTYDIEFTAPKYQDGKQVSNPKMTVRHNGVVVHENAEVPKVTPGGTSKGGPTGPLHLQNHGNPVRYRNIWVLPKP